MGSCHYTKGSRLMIELCSGKIFEGIFWFGDDMKITAKNVLEYPDNIKHEGFFQFYNMEIQSITILDKNTAPSIQEIEKANINKNVEFDQLKELAYNYKYIAVVDNTYHSVIEHLKTCTEIAVIGFGNYHGRNSKISIIGISTKNNIYLFDIKIPGKIAFDLGLKSILEADDINKTVYDCKLLADCLHHVYNVSLQNVFDAQVTDYMICQKNTGVFPDKMRSFSDCISEYLNIPANVIKQSETSPKQLLERPLTDNIKLNSSLQVSYLYVLKRILQNIIMHNLNATTEQYLNSMKNVDHVKSLALMKLDVPSEVKELGLTL